jgi:hypothetical protein
MKKLIGILMILFMPIFVGCNGNSGSKTDTAISPLPETAGDVVGNSRVRVLLETSENNRAICANIIASAKSPFIDAVLYREDFTQSSFERKVYKIIQKKRVEVSSGTAEIVFNSVPKRGMIGVEIKITGGHIGGSRSFYGSSELGSDTVDVTCRTAPGFTDMIPFHEVTELKTLDGKSLQQIATLSFDYYGFNPVIFNDLGEPLIINSDKHLVNVTTNKDYGSWLDFKFNGYNMSALNWFDNKLLAWGNNSVLAIDLSTKSVSQYIGEYGSWPLKTQDNVSYASATMGPIGSSVVYNDQLYMTNVSSGGNFGQIIYGQNGRLYVVEDLSMPAGSNYFPDRIQMTSDGSLYILNFKSTYRGIHKRLAQGSFEYIGLPYSTSGNPADWVATKQAYGHSIDKVYTNENRKIIEYHNGFLISTLRSIIYTENGKAWTWLKSEDLNENRGYDIFKNKNGDIYIASRFEPDQPKLFKLQP